MMKNAANAPTDGQVGATCGRRIIRLWRKEEWKDGRASRHVAVLWMDGWMEWKEWMEGGRVDVWLEMGVRWE